MRVGTDGVLGGRRELASDAGKWRNGIVGRQRCGATTMEGRYFCIRTDDNGLVQKGAILCEHDGIGRIKSFRSGGESK